MVRPAFILLALTLLVESSAIRGEAQTLASALSESDHITSYGPDGPLRDQIRYLIEHWPRDFEIVVVEALGQPKCDHSSSRSCSLRVKPVDVILGHQHGHSYVVSYGPAKHCNDDTDKCVYVYDRVQFEVRRGNKMVAMLTPMMHPPDRPEAYIATRLGNQNRGILPDCPVRYTIQDELEGRDKMMEIASQLAAGQKLTSCKPIDY